MVKKQDVRKDQSSGQATLRQTALPTLFPPLFAGPMKNRYGTTLPPPAPLPVSQTRTVYTRSESKQTARPIASSVMGKRPFSSPIGWKRSGNAFRAKPPRTGVPCPDCQYFFRTTQIPGRCFPCLKPTGPIRITFACQGRRRNTLFLQTPPGTNVTTSSPAPENGRPNPLFPLSPARCSALYGSPLQIRASHFTRPDNATLAASRLGILS